MTATANHKVVCARAARSEFRDAFCRGIEDFRGARQAAAILGRHLVAKLPAGLPHKVLGQLYDHEVLDLAWDGSITVDNAKAPAGEAARIRTMARKRPLQPAELEGRAYDSVSVEGKNRSVVVHDGRVHRDGRTLYMTHSRFCLDRVFSEEEDNDVVYSEACRPLLDRVCDGGRATLLLFGQTGTGKTYTAEGVFQRLASEVFRLVDGPVTISIFEIAGSRGGREAVFDLLAERKAVKCLTGEDGNVHVRGAREVECSAEEELLEALAEGFQWRSSESTERNEASSRSHAVFELRVPGKVGDVSGTRPASLEAREVVPDNAEAGAEPGDAAACGQTGNRGEASAGVLRIVDLAGSERNFETQMHTRKMAERGGHINYSLLMLKECARIMHRNAQRLESGMEKQIQHVPFRSCRLTHLLQSAFTDEEHRTVVVTTLSPSPTDVEHSLNSLQHVGMMRARPRDAPRSRSRQQQGLRAADGGVDNFSKLEGRGHGLHSKLQDARASQMKLHAFGMVTGTGGSVMKKYEPENVKKEAFIDPRWHREMHVVVEEDLWVLKEADAEAVQMLSEWREEQWAARRAHNVSRWSASEVQGFLQGLELPGAAHIPSTMTGQQLSRLSRRALAALCSSPAAAEALYQALQEERAAQRETGLSQAGMNAKMAALGNHKVHVALEAEAAAEAQAQASLSGASAASAPKGEVPAEAEADAEVPP